jgi:hypothetical protein
MQMMIRDVNKNNKQPYLTAIIATADSSARALESPFGSHLSSLLLLDKPRLYDKPCMLSITFQRTFAKPSLSASTAANVAW